MALYKLLALFNETFKELPNLTDKLIEKVSKSWDEPSREQALRILNALKTSLDSESELLVTEYLNSEPWAELRPLKITFSFEECNIKADNISALQTYVENLINKLCQDSHILKFVNGHYDYKEGSKEATFPIFFDF